MDELMQEFQIIDSMLNRVVVSGESVGYLWSARTRLKALSDSIKDGPYTPMAQQTTAEQ